MSVFMYRGVTKNGMNRSGAQEATAADLTKSLYDKRYRWAQVTSPSGVVVGEVCRHLDTGKRTWWAENTGATA